MYAFANLTKSQNFEELAFTSSGVVGLKNMVLAAESLRTARIQEYLTHFIRAVYMICLFTYKHTNYCKNPVITLNC